MDKWAPIAPSKPQFQSASHLSNRFASVLKSSKHDPRPKAPAQFIGKWPEDVLLRIIGLLPIPDLPNTARVNRAFARLVRDERGWEWRCSLLEIQPEPTAPSSSILKDNELKPPISTKRKSSFPARQASVLDDDFGDFAEQNKDVFEDVDFGDFEAAKPTIPQGGSGPSTQQWGTSKEQNLLDFDDLPLPSRPTGSSGSHSRTTGFFALAPSMPSPSIPFTSHSPGPYYLAYKAHHLSLLPFCRHLRSSPSPSSTLSLLFPPSPTTALLPSLSQQSSVLLSLIRFLSPQLQPLRDWGFLRQALLAAADRFDSTCLVAFEVSDGKKDVEGMKEAAESSWNVWEAGGGDREKWECGRVWVEKREVFYDTARWDSLENIIKVQTKSGATVRQLDFTPMDAFMSHVLEAFRIDAQTAHSVFPPKAKVVLSFCDRLSNEVIGEYIHPLLSQARAISQDLFLRATAATFVQAWKLVDVTMEVLGDEQNVIKKEQVEDSVFHMFEEHLDDYLDDETERVKDHLEDICRAWEQQLGTSDSAQLSKSHAPTFLTSANPDQVKRNVLASFKDALLLPVTIVPRTVTFGVNAIVSGGTQAVSGLAMLNPQKWTGKGGVVKEVKEGEEVVFEAKDIDEIEETANSEIMEGLRISENMENVKEALEPNHGASLNDVNARLAAGPLETSHPSTPTPQNNKSFDRLQLLVSLDTALELIQVDRDSLKRAETFAKYRGKVGLKVKEAIEEIFIFLLKAVGDRHIAPGFKIATNEMSTYKPAEHEETTSVAPLLQFFELVHIGDTIQSMVQVYFDKELSPYVDKTDFLNAVMREKKRFESVLDDAVAAGLNAGIEVLMNQVEHIILVKTGPREYYPVEGTPMELGPTQGCKEAIACLEMHCNLLKGSTSKEVLEVFYQEVGIRLEAIIQRHIKRQIISLEGGFQVIADLNAYYNFVSSLKQQRITDDFSDLKMLGNVYIVSDARDLAQIVRDVSRYGGAFTPEDIYEFIQRRSDWKKIEKTVDKAMYALSVREDCVVM
ncbi:recyclin-1 [Cryptococcus gattii Ru294]|uniref:Recyclin-1 n=1 Tax=Cryptococcus gattii EJB2 TaxID=1296103 RepID=A0ABR5C064_9TREE|nr:recyclin-1 [Cryptococcus gattii Ru294]KIR81283.1 recyclin-1 [Cryptococcus gattii EJB2]KIY35029.1 recyclin-1 [Cryptococcus gattii E566]KJE03841.1 recyclin-1 [Cryptococcus gattii NT-10]